MKNIRHLMLASKGQGTTTNSAAQQQNIRHNQQDYGFTAKATVRTKLLSLSCLSVCLHVCLSVCLSVCAIYGLRILIR